MDRNEFKSSTLLILLAAFAAGLLGLWLGQRFFSSPAASFHGKVLLYPQPRPLAEFALQRADGSTLGTAELKGRWTLVFFGFTHCPDVCPTTLALLAAVNKQLSAELPAEKRPQILFVSVDPERDSGPRMQEYVSYFSPDIIAASGSAEAIDGFTRQLGAQFIRQPADANGEYSVDHSADLFLLGPDATRRGLIRPPFTASVLAADLKVLPQ